MKILIGGLPYFAKKLVSSLSEFDKENSYSHLERITKPGDRIKTFYKIISADLVYFIDGIIYNNKLMNLALLLKKRIVMHWVGSDVIRAAKDINEHKENVAYFKKIDHYCEVSWIKNELYQIGIDAQTLQIASFDVKDTETPELPPEFSILSYVRKNLEEFYGFDKIIQLAADFPDIKIKIAGLDSYKEPIPKNIELLGWIKNMDEQYQNCVLFLRLPKHDGLAFSVLEALACGRYVGYSCQFDNTVYIDTYETLKKVVENLHSEFKKGSLTPNLKGVKYIREHHNHDEVLRNIIQRLKGD